MKRVNELSSRVKSPYSNFLDVNKLYSNIYKSDSSLTNEQIIRALRENDTSYKFIQRINKLARYLNQLLGGPSPLEIRKSISNIIESNLDSLSQKPTILVHDFMHLIIGQSIKLFEKKLSSEEYTVYHNIYETIVLFLESGVYYSATFFFNYIKNYLKYDPEENSYKTFKIELSVVDSVCSLLGIKRTSLIYNTLVSKILDYQIISGYALRQSLVLKSGSSEFPLAGEFLRQFCEYLEEYFPNNNVSEYKKLLTTHFKYLLRNEQYLSDANLGSTLDETKGLKKFMVNALVIKDIFSRMEIFPSEMEVVISKFLKYLVALLMHSK